MNLPPSESISPILEFPVRTELHRVPVGEQFRDKNNQLFEKVGVKVINPKKIRHLARVVSSTVWATGTVLTLEGKTLVAIRGNRKAAA